MTGFFHTIARCFVCVCVMLSSGQWAQAVVLPPGVSISTLTLISFDDLLVPVPTPFNPAGTPVFADFNGDGKQDLLVQALNSGGATYLFLADVNGKYTSIAQQWKNGHLNLNWSSDVSNLWVGDYDGDGRADIIVESKITNGRNALIYTSSGATLIDRAYQTWDNPSTTSNISPAASNPIYSTIAGSTAGSFDVSQSGAATYQIPVVVPPGINGLVPNVSLNYNSQGGNGNVGMGWSLGGLSAIYRCPRTIAQDGSTGSIDFTVNDRFCLDGQRLVKIGSANGGIEYRTEIESYLRVIAYGGRADDPAYFTVWGKDGKVMQYGATVNSHIEAQGRSDAMLWAINRISDVKGNNIDFSYYENSAIGEFHIDRINYAGNRSVRFVFEARTDTSSSYTSGSLTSNTKRLTNIKTYIAEAGIDTLVRNYRLYYEIAPATSRSRVKYLQECSAVSCLPATTFDWQNSPLSFTGSNWSGHGGGASNNALGDFNGDGKTDMAGYTGSNGNWHVCLSTGGGFSCSYMQAHLGGAANNALGDFNGDGKTDMASYTGSNGMWNVCLSSGAGFSCSTMQAHVGGAANNALGDFNGDGKTDMAGYTSSNGVWNVCLSTGVGFSCNTTSAHGGGATNNALGDFNGDGKTDMAGYTGSNGNWHVCLSTGKGFSCSYMQAHGGGVANNVLGDFNGDGKTDMASYTGSNGVWNVCLFIGAGFSCSAMQAHGGGAANNVLGDFNGDGKIDMARYTGSSGAWEVSLQNGPFPDLLTTITTGQNIVTAIQYKPLTDSSVYTKRNDSVPGDTVDVQGAIHVVANHSVSNGVGGLNTVTHRYEGLKTQLNGRGSLGFSNVVHTDVVTNSSTSISYSQTFPYAGLPVYVETKVNNVTIAQKTLMYTAPSNTGNNGVTTSVGADGVLRYNAPYAYFVGESKWDLDGASTTTNSTNIIQNRYGSVTELSVTTRGDGYGSYTKTITNVYAHELDTDPSLTAWRTVSQIKTATSTSVIPRAWNDGYTRGSNIRKSSFEYYADGLLKRETIEPDNTSLSQVTTYGYDRYGNRISDSVSGYGLSSPRTIITTYSPDGLFPVRVTNVLGHIESRVYDARFGAISSFTDSNNLTTTYYYDEYGRLTGELYPDGTSTTTGYASCNSATCMSNEAYYVTTRSTATPTTVGYFDMFGRELRRTTEGFDGRLATNETRYNARGHIDKISQPYYPGDVVYWINHTYDGLGRMLTETIPATADVAQNTTTYSYTAFKTTATNGRLFTKEREINALGQLIRMKEVAPDAVAPASPSTTTPVETRYDYDYFGNLRYISDPKGNVIRTYYDVRGRKVAMDDPDMGHWEYEYNAVGQVISQWDAKSGRNTMTNPVVNASAVATTRMEYDGLGRLIKRTEAEGVSEWVYDTAYMGKGEIAHVSGPGGYSRRHGYDHLGRSINIATTVAGATFVQETGYDAYGRIETTRYPETRPGVRLQVNNVYTSTGYLSQSKNASTNQIYWQATQKDAAGRLIESRLGNGLTTIQGYDQQHGYLLNIKTQRTGSGVSSVQNLAYGYDAIGNVRSRTVGLPELNTSYRESYTYDAFNRLRTTTGTGGPASKSYSYDVLGNIKSKSDAAAEYVYGDAAHVHAVTALKNSAGATIATYSYDANGNMVYGNGRTTDHSSYNLPWNIVQGSNSITFVYDADHQRMLQITNDEITTYLSPRLDTGTHFEKVNHTATGVVEYKHYIYGGDGPVAIYAVASNSTSATTRYLHKDHLGSIEAVTDESGNLVERLSYDAFGKRRLSNGVDAPVVAQTTQYGFTSHEMLDAVGLIHMNGRVYDPHVGRFIEADPYIQFPENSQSYNRYSYVLNSPLSFTDPSGYKLRWKSIRGAIKAAVGATVIAFSGLCGPAAAQCGSVGVALVASGVDDLNNTPKEQRQDPGYSLSFGANYGGSGDTQYTADLEYHPSGEIVFGQGYSLLGYNSSGVPYGLGDASRAPQALPVIVVLLAEWSGPIIQIARVVGPRASQWLGKTFARKGVKQAERDAETSLEVNVANKTTNEVLTRKSKGGDGGASQQIIERDASGNVISRTHKVTTDGKTVHQHQNHVGKEGGVRQFPDEWTGTETINAPYENIPPKFPADRVPGGRKF